MDRMKVVQALKAGQAGQMVDLRGWVRTRRDSKQAFSFVELNDGSCMANLQVVIDANVPLIDEVSAYSQLMTSGHKAQTIIVPPSTPGPAVEGSFLRNIDITGILNKPFDPEELLKRLPVLAA